VSQSLFLSDPTTGRGQLQKRRVGFRTRRLRATPTSANRRPIRTCSRNGVADGFDELTALVLEIEQIPEEARFSCPYE
jgi:hypothetical protein